MRCRRLIRLSGRTSCFRCCCLISARASCGCLTLRLILVRAGCRCLIRRRLVLIRAGCGRLTLRLILVRAGCSCFIRRRLVLIRAGCSRLSLGSFLIRANRTCFVPSCLALGGLVRGPGLLGRYHAMTAKLGGLGRRRDCRAPVVHGGQECVVATRSVQMLRLHRGWGRVSLSSRGLFPCGWAGADSTAAAVIADMVDRGVVDYGLVVNVVNVRDVHVIHRAVVVEGSVVPISAFVADATIAETVIDATVKAYLGTPVSVIPGKGVAAPTPITGSPEQARFGSHHPGTRHPEVTVIPVRPITGRPHVTVGGGHGLLIHR